MNLRELTEWWHESLGATASPRTRKLYRDAADALLAWLEATGRGTEDVPDRRTLDTYFAEFRARPNARTGKPLSAAYVQQHWRSLQQLYRWLETEELLERNPFTTGMEKPRIPDSPVPIFTDDELSALFKATAGKDSRARRDRAILRTLVDTGVRVGELVGIDREHVDYGQKVILVTGKAGHARAVPFNTKLYGELRRWEMVRPTTNSPRMFVGLRGRSEALTTSGVRQLLNTMGDTAGVADMHPHRFRHTLAHLWMASGGLESDLQRIMGWRSPQMITRYAASAGSERAQNAAWRLAIGDRY